MLFYGDIVRTAKISVKISINQDNKKTVVRSFAHKSSNLSVECIDIPYVISKIDYDPTKFLIEKQQKELLELCELQDKFRCEQDELKKTYTAFLQNINTTKQFRESPLYDILGESAVQTIEMKRGTGTKPTHKEHVLLMEQIAFAFAKKNKK